MASKSTQKRASSSLNEEYDDISGLVKRTIKEIAVLVIERRPTKKKKSNAGKEKD